MFLSLKNSPNHKLFIVKNCDNAGNPKIIRKSFENTLGHSYAITNTLPQITSISEDLETGLIIVEFNSAEAALQVNNFFFQWIQFWGIFFRPKQGKCFEILI